MHSNLFTVKSEPVKFELKIILTICIDCGNSLCATIRNNLIGSHDLYMTVVKFVIIVSTSPTYRLVLGETTLDVAMGTSCGFLQELACVRTNQDIPEMTVLGQLSHRLVCTPDFEAMLAGKR